MKINEFKLERFFAKHEFSAPYLLCCSDCESFTVEELFSLDKNAEKEFKELRLGYTESLGSPVLREAITTLYQEATPEDMIVFTGAEEGIFIFMNALLNPGDHIIVQFPCYQSLTEVARAIGCTVSEWNMDPGYQWELDIEWLEKNITASTRAIVINFPNNPTGYLPSLETFLALVDIARQRGLYIFSDEVYRWLEYHEEDRLPAGCDVYERGVSLGVMSKSFGLPGLRIGWIVTKDRSLLNKIAAFKDFTTICNSAPGEFLASLALRNKEFILRRNLDIIKTNLEHLEEFFTQFPGLFTRVTPKAGPLLFPYLEFTGDGEAFCRDLLEKKGVLLAPGSRFNYSSRYFRLGFGRKNMPEALAGLAEYLQERF